MTTKYFHIIFYFEVIPEIKLISSLYIMLINYTKLKEKEIRNKRRKNFDEIFLNQVYLILFKANLYFMNKSSYNIMIL